MILHEIYRNEEHPVYKQLETSNGERHYDFLRSIVEAAVAANRPFISQQILRSLNYHAIACLHTHAGEFRPCEVSIGEHIPPAWYRVQAQMDDFINDINREMGQADPVYLATYALWRINHIHPFINGNGRTARAAAHFIICVLSGGWLPGSPILPRLIREDRDKLCEYLKHADQTAAAGQVDLKPLHELVSNCLKSQIESAGIPVET